MTAPSKAWVVISDSQVAPNAPGDTVLMTGIRDDLVHLEEWLGDSYTAAKDHSHNGVDSAPLGLTGLVGQGELKTSMGAVSTTGNTNLTLPGGSYGFYPQVKGSSASTMAASILTTATNVTTAYVTYVSLFASGVVTAFAQQRYVTASAPFNLGNGDIPLFVFALIDNASGLIEATYTADTPQWFYNGSPRNTFDPKKYKKRKGKENYFYDRPLPLPDKTVDFAAYLEAINTPLEDRVEEIEITPAMKNLDMDIIPHPFMANDLTGKSVVLLDPVGSMAEKMRDLHDMGESVADLLHDGYLLVDNEDLDANTPVGVTTHKVKWK